MTHGPAAQVEFTFAELDVLCSLLSLPGLAALSNQVRRADASRTEATEHAHTSLRERQAVSAAGEVGPGLRTLLETAAHPLATLEVQVRHPGLGVEAAVIAAGAQISTESLLLPDRVRLTPIARAATLSRAFERLGLLDEPTSPADLDQPLVVSAEWLRASLHKSPDGSHPESGRTGEQDGALAAAITHSPGVFWIRVLHSPANGRVEGGELAWIRGVDGSLFLVPEWLPEVHPSPDSGAVEIHSTNPQAIANECLGYLSPSGGRPSSAPASAVP